MKTNGLIYWRIPAFTLIGFLSLTLLFSCEDAMGDFLEKAPGVDVSEDTIFSSKTQVDFFLTSLYQYGIHSNLGYSRINPVTNNSMTLLSGATDESETIADWYSTQEWNKATINPAAPDDPRFNYRWIAIRKTIIMLDRVDEVVVKDPTMTPEYARQLKAEAKFIRALNYFEMLKRYGGVPIIDRRIGLDENLKIPRNSLADVVDFILKDCNEAIPDLPFEQAPNLKGRATKLTVMALRAKTLLYAASPLFNTATPPLDFADKELICYGNYDPNRWRAAATAIKAVLDTAAISNCYLIITQGTDRNYKYTWDIYDNPEIIFAEKANKDCNRWEWPWSAIAPYSIYPGSTGGTSGISPTLNFVRKYEDKSGHTVDWSGGDDLQAKMASLDPRFAQTIAYNLSRWNAEFPQVQIYQGGRDAQFCYGGFWLHKLYPETLTKDGGIWAYKPNSTLFQLNEFYLAYAEALNEINNGPTAEAYQYINDIRARSGMPNIPAGLGYDDFKKRVQKERAVELAFDDHRFWDIRRWMIAEQDGVMRGDMWGIKIYPIVGNATEYRYEPYVFETRSFDKKMYLHPFSTGEINKGYLIQNPGY